MNTVSRHAHFFECAEQVASTYAHPSQKVVLYLVTDSVHLREDAVKAFPDGKVVVSGFHPQHLELAWTDVARGLGGVEPVEAEELDVKEIKLSLDGMMETVAENW